LGFLPYVPVWAEGGPTRKADRPSAGSDAGCPLAPTPALRWWGRRHLRPGRRRTGRLAEPPGRGGRGWLPRHGDGRRPKRNGWQRCGEWAHEIRFYDPPRRRHHPDGAPRPECRVPAVNVSRYSVGLACLPELADRSQGWIVRPRAAPTSSLSVRTPL